MKKIGIHGSYYSRNFGDTLILHIIKNWVEEYSSNINISLPFVTSEEEEKEILGIINKRTKVEELDGVIFGPGGYFGERPGNLIKRLKWSIRNYKRHISWNNKLYRYKIPYMIVGVGVGPISFNFLKKGIVKLFSNAQYISVRDKYSRQYLIEWGIDENRINLAPDVALTLEPTIQVNLDKNIRMKKVALHYPNDNIVDSGKMNDFISFIKKITSDNEVYLLEDTKGQYSSEKANNLNDIFRKHGLKLPIIQYRNPSDLIKKIREMDKIITSKLHVGIVGYALGKKMLSIPSHSKTIRFYEQIQQEEFCIPLKEIDVNILYEKFTQLDSRFINKNILFNDALKNKNAVFEFLKKNNFS